MRSILCYLLFAIGGTVTYVCAEEKEQIGSDTLENILFVDDFDAKCVVPDTAIWKLCTYANNAWSQYFRGVDGYENVKVEEGYLKLRACKDNGTYKNGGVFSSLDPFIVEQKTKLPTRKPYPGPACPRMAEEQWGCSSGA